VVLEKDGEDQLDRSYKNVKVLHRVEEGRIFLHTRKRMKFDRICHNLHMNCLLTHVIEGKMKGRSEGKMKKKK
jgi:hypothetical protein